MCGRGVSDEELLEWQTWETEESVAMGTWIRAQAAELDRDTL